MPTLGIYEFEHKIDSGIRIIIWGYNEEEVIISTKHYLKESNNFELIK